MYLFQVLVIKISHFKHISFYKVFFDKKQSPRNKKQVPPQAIMANICGRDSLRPPRYLFFSDPAFSKFETEDCPPPSRIGGGCIS